MANPSNPPNSSTPSPDWTSIRARGVLYPRPAFDFVREGLSYTVGRVHGATEQDPAVAQRTTSHHVGGRDLCMGLRDLAIRKYGLLALTVLRRWGIRRTDDFGVIVYTMIDRKELRPSDDDRFDDFAAVYDFEEAFTAEQTCSLP